MYSDTVPDYLLTTVVSQLIQVPQIFQKMKLITFFYFWITSIPHMWMMTPFSQLEGRTYTIL